MTKDNIKSTYNIIMIFFGLIAIYYLLFIK